VCPPKAFKANEAKRNNVVTKIERKIITYISITRPFTNIRFLSKKEKESEIKQDWMCLWQRNRYRVKSRLSLSRKEIGRQRYHKMKNNSMCARANRMGTDNDI